MYLIVIAWMYVVLMMSIAEATSSNGTILGALVTFVMYGVGPVSLVVYLLGAPARSKTIKQREVQAHAAQMAADREKTSPDAMASIEPDAGRHAASGSEPVTGDPGVAPVRKEP